MKSSIGVCAAMSQSNEELFRPGIERLAATLRTPAPRVADWRVVPLALVLDLADLFSVDLPKGTAEAQLRHLIDEAGIVGPDGSALLFRDYQSASIADDLAKVVDDARRNDAKLTKKVRQATLTEWSHQDQHARTKFEAVNKISMLTDSGPETLGPGSKERKSVLINLHKGLGLGDATDHSKIELGGKIAARLGVDWDRRCYSTGETITLEGLNRLLAAATAELESTRVRTRLSARDEATMYAAVIMQQILGQSSNGFSKFDIVWNGRLAVEEMLDADYPHARQTEWPGWYFEYKALTSLISTFGGGPHKVEGTEFDYRNIRTWDLKSHSETSPVAPLNDKHAIRGAAEEDGIGFIILGGIPKFSDEDEFYLWHNEVVRGNPPKPRKPSSRRLKTEFELRSLTFNFIDDLRTLNRLEQDGILTDFNQGRQADGSPRKVKYNLNCTRAREDSTCVYRLDVAEYLERLIESEYETG